MKLWVPDDPADDDLKRAIVMASADLEPEQVPQHECARSWHRARLLMLPSGSVLIMLQCQIDDTLAEASCWRFEPADIELFDWPSALTEALRALGLATRQVQILADLGFRKLYLPATS